MRLTSEKVKLYKASFDVFFVGELTFRGFCRITDQARFLVDENDGELLNVSAELSSLLEDTVEDPALLAELNISAERHGKHRYISLEQAMPQIRALYSRIAILLARHLT